MNTQNVKTAAPESTERCGKTTFLCMGGLITDISSAHPFDVIRADVVISRMEKQAQASCGLHWEILELRLINSAREHLCRLPVKDRPVFIGAATRRGLTLTLAEEERCQKAHDVLMAEIAADY